MFPTLTTDKPQPVYAGGPNSTWNPGVLLTQSICTIETWVLAHASKSVKALRYKPEGHGYENRWGEWFLSIYLIILALLDSGVYSASNRNKCQEQKNTVLWGVVQRSARKADNLAAIYESTV
jgi:hypothetical protein